MKNKIEFNQESIKRFFVHHWEKLAFGIGIISIGLLAYFGMNSEGYDKITPAQLDSKVQNANNRMANSKWEDISEQRKADVGAPSRITESINNPVDNSVYTFGQFMGTAMKSQTLRADPVLLQPEDFDVRWVRTQAPYRNANSVLNRLPLRNPPAGPGQSDDNDRGRLSSGDGDGKGGEGRIGDGDGAVGSEGLGGSNASAGGQAIGGSGRGGTGVAGSGLSNTLPPELLRIYHSPRPADLNLNVASNGPLPMNLICVTALVPYKDQLQKYRDLFENSVGYNELRDMPVYTYLEVQMKEDDGDWKDVTDVVTKSVNNQLIGKGPEPVKKEYINPALTQPIPALLGTDYRQLVNHPALENHVWYDPSDKVSTDSTDTDVRATDVFGGGGTEDTAKAAATDEEEKKDPEYYLLRFFYPAAKAGSTYQFRVRIWLGDPNNPLYSTVDISSVVSGERRGGMGQDGALANGPGQSQSAGQAGIEDEKGGGAVGRGRGSASENVSLNMLDPKVRNRLSAESEEWKKKQANMKKSTTGNSKQPAAGDRDRDRDRERGQAQVMDDEQLMKLMMVSRPTDWSEPTPAVTIGNSQPSYYAGSVKADTDRVNDLEYHDGETTGSLVVKTRIGDVAVDGAAERKTVYPGDGLNWKSIWTIIHPIDLSIRQYYENASDQSTTAKKEEEKEGKVVKTDSVLIDIMGGEEVRNLRTREKEYMLPGQFLIMDDSGNFTVADEVSDQGKYRLALAKVNLEEEVKVKKTDDDDKDDRDRGLLTGGGGKR